MVGFIVGLFIGGFFGVVVMAIMNVAGVECDKFKDRSRFVELPCKLGDVVFIVFDDRVLDCEVIRISFSKKHKNANLTLENKKFGTIYGFLSDGDSEFFFTREEAEQALKERERK